MIVDIHAGFPPGGGNLHPPDLLLQDIGGDFISVNRDVPGCAASQLGIKIAVFASFRRGKSDRKPGNLRNSDSPLSKPLFHLFHRGQEAAPHGLHDEHSLFLRQGVQTLSLSAVYKHSLLAEHRDAPLHAHPGQAVMVVGRHRDVGAVGLLFVKQFLVTAVSFGDVVPCGELLRPLQALAGHGTDLTIPDHRGGLTKFRAYFSGAQYGITKCTHFSILFLTLFP